MANILFPLSDCLVCSSLSIFPLLVSYVFPVNLLLLFSPKYLDLHIWTSPHITAIMLVKHNKQCFHRSVLYIKVKQLHPHSPADDLVAARWLLVGMYS